MIDGKFYIIAQAWNPGDFVILEPVIESPVGPFETHTFFTHHVRGAFNSFERRPE
ncbi:MAG: hypothetical protein O7E52_28160 [Candidatus Poribacteria bacterium]|nr:hypothetical protein [Candidatus Poribacteria bacterium]